MRENVQEVAAGDCCRFLNCCLFPRFFQKTLAFSRKMLYTDTCCGMIAMKCEVAAASTAGFPWSECQVRKLATSHCITIRSLHKSRNSVCKAYDTHGEVYSHRLSY